MATKTIYWGDGTSDKITVEFSGTGGSSDIVISSDPNITILERRKTITVKTADGKVTHTITVNQQARNRAYSSAYNEIYL